MTAAPTLRLTVLGCSGSYPSPDNPCTGYLVQHGETSVWLDCGPGTLGPLQRYVELDRLSAVYASHSHPDHWLDLPILRNALRYYLDRSGVPLYTTEETLRRLEAVLGKPGPAPTLEPHVVSEGSRFTVGGLEFTCSRTDHPVETLAVRIDTSSGSLGYSADTGPRWSMAALGSGIDLALWEATMPESEADDAVHTSARQAAALARDAGVRRLVLTHVPPTESGEAQRAIAEGEFGGPVDLATPGAVFELREAV